MRVAALGIALTLASATLARAAGPQKAGTASTAAIALPGGEGGIGFDDLQYSRTLGKVIVPGGRAGRLYLVDAATGAVTSISGFSTMKTFSGGHDDGITSVAEGAGLLFVTDRTREDLSIIDPASRTVVARTRLSASPDYVRWIDPMHELWVTEPDSARIEVFRLDRGKPPRAVRIATIEVPEGPESLILDSKRRRVHTHVASGTAAIDVRSRSMTAFWKNGCEEAKGIAIDPERGFLFVACQHGGVNVIDVQSGELVGNYKAGAGVDIISYSPELGHLYVPSSETKTLAILGVGTGGALTLLGTVPGTADSHCVAAAGKVYFCDPARGRLLAYLDPYPSSVH